MTSEELVNKESDTSQNAKMKSFSTPLRYEEDSPPNLVPPRVECYLDKENHIRHMAYIGTLHHEQLITQVLDIWSHIPDLGKYDNLIDMRFHKGDVGWHTVKEIGKQWSLHFDGHAPNNRTVFVSTHISFTILIKAIQAFAPEHTFQAFNSKTKAMAWLMKKE
ncbi:hypothetical protein [Kiloniella sp.]|uniref:hypothetical protein n=1 Tax=Kiloniella sp. TaxID=1938587 RepID=UPI003B01DE9A